MHKGNQKGNCPDGNIIHLAQFILQPQYTDNPQNVCEVIIRNAHFKVVVRDFHATMILLIVTKH